MLSIRSPFRSRGTSAILSIVAVVALAASSASAGTIRHDRDDQLYRDRAALPQFAAVGTYSERFFGSLTLIAPDWALTAAHVVDADADGDVDDEDIGTGTGTATVRIGGVSRKVSRLVVPKGTNGNPGWNGSINSGFDLALVQLSEPITTVLPAKLYTGFQELGQTITSVGFGQTGTGLTGATRASGTKRAGDNVVDGYINFANGATALQWDFDEPAPRVSPNFSGSSVPLDLEYMIGPGDSGGGSFLFDGVDWLLAGVHSGVYNRYGYPGTGTDGSTYGDSTLITRVSAYQQFISMTIPNLTGAVVPEPASLAGAAVAGLLLRRRRRPA